MPPSFPAAPSDFYLFRTPALPFEFLEPWSRHLDNAPSEDLETHREDLREHLKEAVRRPEIRDALFLASPDLEEMLDPWLEGALPPDKRDRVDRSLVRYLSRMASRSTPFGLFAGCSLGKWGETTFLATEAWLKGERHTRLDMDYLCALAEALEKDPVVRRALHYRPNTSLYSAAGRFRYAEERHHPARGREYHLVALGKSAYLEATLLRARGGASREALAAALAVGDITREEAEGFIDELIDSQVLVSDLYPAVTGAEPIHRMVDRLRSAEDTAPMAMQLEAVRDALKTLDEGGLGQAPARYRTLAANLEALPAKIKLKFLFQVDLAKPAPEARLHGGVQAALGQAVDLLRRLAPPRSADPMKAFKDAFSSRYEERWVPLLEALDDEIGIGFASPGAPAAEASPLLDGLHFPGGAGGEGPLFSERSSYMLKRLQELGSAPEWELTDGDIKALENPDPVAFPDAFACTLSLAAASPQSLDRGDFQVLLEGYSGPSGARLLGRFCHGDPRLEAHVREHLQGEAALHPDVIFAEIAHLPEGRMGNILCRPLLREHEIPFLGVSGAPDAAQIPLQDLLVSVRQGRVALRSRSLGKEVAPRLTSAHNYTRGLGIYRFLCALQDQGAGGVRWTWGPLDSLPYLPRVRRGRHILQKARWLVRQEEIKAIAAAPPSEAFRAFGELKARRGFPRMVLLADGDNELLVDLHHPLWVETLLHLVARRASFQLQEFFPGPGDLVAQGPEGRFCHELVVPFLRIPQAADAKSAEPAPPADPLPRTFLPGSEWLYLKIYTGTSTADALLLQALAPFLKDCEDLYDRWFFIRYADPEPHLRLRFHGDPSRLTQDLLPRLHGILAPLQGAGWVWKVQVDTYEREMERYGGPSGILPAEDLFNHDSRAVLDLVDAYPGDEGASWRWRMGLKSVDALLGDMGFDLKAKAAIIRNARVGFAREFESSQGLDVELGAKFRSLRKELDAFLFLRVEDPAALPGLRILETRSRALRPCLDRLKAAEDAGNLLRSRAELATSFTHMHLNRLLRSAQRAQEFVIYDFLHRLYESRLARERKG